MFLMAIIKTFRMLVLCIIMIHPAVTVAQSPSKSYFPRSTFNDSKADWYAKSLIAMDETSLLQKSNEKNLHCYRFLWLRSFDPSIVIRLTIDPEGTGTITAKIAKKSGDSEPGGFKVNDSVSLTKDSVDKFLSELAKSQFWQLPAREKEKKNADIIIINIDGAQWIIEGIRSGQYHVVDRWSPTKGSYRYLGLLLIELAKLKVKDIY